MVVLCLVKCGNGVAKCVMLGNGKVRWSRVMLSSGEAL